MASVWGAACGAFLLAAFLAASFAAVVGFFPSATGSARAAATLTVLVWLLVAVFHLLAWGHVFRLEAALAASAAALWLLRRGATRWRAALAEQASGARTLVAEMRRPFLAILATLALTILSVRLLRGLVVPPLGWDSLTYHLVKAARWIHAAGFWPEAAPDSTGAYEYFPYAGDLIWAWAMLPFQGDGALAAAGILVVAGCGVATYALAREVGGDRMESSLAGLAFAFLPPCINFATAAYVDNTAALCAILGLLFLCRLLRGADIREGILAAAALGCGAGTKAALVPTLAMGLVVIAGCVTRERARERRAAVVVGVLSACAIGLPGYVRAWLERGSPFYPLPLVLGGRTLAAGHEGMALALAGQLDAVRQDFRPILFLQHLFLPDPRFQFLNPGPAAPLLAALGLAGAVWICIRRRRETPRVILLLATAGLVALGLSGPDTFGLRTYWVGVLGRFLLPALACFAALAAGLGGRLARGLLAVVVATGLWLAIPRGWSKADAVPVLQLAGLLVTGVAVAGLFVRFGRSRGRPKTALAGVLSTLAICIGLWDELRASSRYPIYRDAAKILAYDAHPLSPSYAGAWPIWRLFDGGRPWRIAVAAGWNGIGDNWYRYPLFGSRLQNEIVYVPPTVDGSVVDYRLGGILAANASRSAWLERLLTAKIDALVLLSPLPPFETRWAAELPQVFVSAGSGVSATSLAFSFDADEARRALAAAQKH